MGPAIGRLMFANWPPLGLFQLHTFGGVYSGELLIHAAPDLKAAGRRNRGARRKPSIGALLEGFPVRPSAAVAHASGVRQRLDCIVAALDVVEPEGVAGRGIVRGLPKRALKSA